MDLGPSIAVLEHRLHRLELDVALLLKQRITFALMFQVFYLAYPENAPKTMRGWPVFIIRIYRRLPPLMASHLSAAVHDKLVLIRQFYATIVYTLTPKL
jgi:hypothetical protein